MNNDRTGSKRVRSLGKTGIRITSIGQGAMQFSGGSLLGNLMFPSMSEYESNANKEEIDVEAINNLKNEVRDYIETLGI